MKSCSTGHGQQPLIVAHRGASRDAPENTLPAFLLAWERGSDAIEGDFHLSKDGHIVCIHDEDTGRVAGRKLVVKESTLEELRELDVGAHHGKEFAGTAMPTLVEVLGTVPKGKKIYVEIKSGTELLPQLLEDIENSGLENDQIIVIAFDPDVIRSLKQKAPQYSAFWLCGLKVDESGKLSPSPADVRKTLEHAHADGVSTGQKNVSHEFINEMHDAGFQYHVWTIDDAKTACRFKEWGAQSITSNVPEFIREHVIEGAARENPEAPDR